MCVCVKYVEYSLVEVTGWEPTKNTQDPQTALRNAEMPRGCLSSEEKGEEECEFQHLPLTFKPSLPAHQHALRM